MKDVGRTWSLGGVYIAVEKDSLDKPKLRYSEHAVLDSVHTVVMLYGKELDYREIVGVLRTDLATLQALVGNGWVALNSDQGFEGNYFIDKLSIDTLNDTKSVTPVYRVTINMRKQ